MSTPCAPGLFTSSWHYRDFVKWTPDGAAILFTQGASLYAVAADGSRLWQLLKPPVADGDPVGLVAPFSIAPDGGRIVYATCEYGDPQATAARRDDLQRQALAGRIVQGTWWAGYDHKYELASIQINGADHVRLTQNRRFDNFPAWSPDGTHIAFLSSDDRMGESNFLYSVAADGTEPRQIGTGPGDLSPHSPQWAPAGDKLAVVAEGGETGNLIYVVRADGTGRQQVTETVSLPSWSPDGTRLAFARPDGQNVALYTIAADGTDARRLATIEGWQPKNRDLDPTRAWIEPVAWSPDGSRILYWCGGLLCVVAPDGRPLGTSPNERWAWGATSLAAWAPDGSRIAIVRRSQHVNNLGDVVLYSVAPDGSDGRVLVRWGRGLVADQALNSDVATGKTACAAGYVAGEPKANAGLVRDCLALLELRDGLFGHSMVNWGPGTPISQWEGVTVTGTPPRVTGLRLYADDVLPAEIVKLSQLKTLDISSARGAIPPELGQLANLEVLRLPNSRLRGSIPPWLGNLAQLRELSVEGNGLTGGIPPEFGQLTQLRKLSVKGDQLTGSLPPELGQLMHLQLLRVVGTQIAGGIPPAFGQLAKLTELELSRNRLTGEIPRELGYLTDLTELDLRYNQLTGEIPVELGELINLSDLDLSHNQLTGRIPAELGKLVNLSILDLSENHLTGTIPPEVASLERLLYLHVGGNQLKE